MNLDDLIDNVIAKTSNNYKNCVLFMIDCMDLIDKDCPPIGKLGIKVATEYWIKNLVDSLALEQARVECWDYLDENNASTNIESSKFCAVRAVICILYSNPPFDDNGELLEWFFNMLCGVKRNTDVLIGELLVLIEALDQK